MVDAKKILEWVNKRRNDNVMLPFSLLGFMKVVFVLLLFFLSLLMIYIHAPWLILDKRIWLIGSLAVYIISISGIYSAVNLRAPFIGRTK